MSTVSRETKPFSNLSGSRFHCKGPLLENGSGNHNGATTSRCGNLEESNYDLGRKVSAQADQLLQPGNNSAFLDVQFIKKLPSETVVAMGADGVLSQSWRCKKKKLSGCKRRERARLRKEQSKENGAAEQVNPTRKVDDMKIGMVNAKTVEGSGSSPLKAPFVIKLAVIAESFPEQMLGEEEYFAIQGILWNKLESMHDPLPKFNMMNVTSGAIHIHCDDEGTKNWLNQTLTESTVKGIRLKLVDVKNLLKSIKMAWKSRNLGCLEEERVLKMLQRFHPKLLTTGWKIVNTSVSGISVRRIVFMDLASANYIKNNGYRLFTGVDLSLFKLLDNTKKLTGKAEASDCTASVEADSTSKAEKQKAVPTPELSMNGQEIDCYEVPNFWAVQESVESSKIIAWKRPELLEETCPIQGDVIDLTEDEIEALRLDVVWSARHNRN
ncbi:uncharacterized protein LOC113516143 [Galleria mellonella]|uniref:Uncharacterized protein LOC113516143 n=1 Tax=Galleria mellonella TaxID=7137 RepID=A0A6J1WN91_GALME|nr:uncharacterized protein LOC113516143 [Galleria mellonella]